MTDIFQQFFNRKTECFNKAVTVLTFRFSHGYSSWSWISISVPFGCWLEAVEMCWFNVRWWLLWSDWITFFTMTKWRHFLILYLLIGHIEVLLTRSRNVIFVVLALLIFGKTTFVVRTNLLTFPSLAFHVHVRRAHALHVFTAVLYCEKRVWSYELSFLSSERWWRMWRW